MPTSEEEDLLFEGLIGTIPDYKISVFAEQYKQGKLPWETAQLLAELYANGEIDVIINLFSLTGDFVEIVYNEPS
tara:strand:+ start:2805 stop:3029 length:225 start_codon:yes stop_codon:yes gene_type:complete